MLTTNWPIQRQHFSTQHRRLQILFLASSVLSRRATGLCTSVRRRALTDLYSGLGRPMRLVKLLRNTRRANTVSWVSGTECTRQEILAVSQWRAYWGDWKKQATKTLWSRWRKKLRARSQGTRSSQSANFAWTWIYIGSSFIHPCKKPGYGLVDCPFMGCWSSSSVMSRSMWSSQYFLRAGCLGSWHIGVRLWVSRLSGKHPPEEPFDWRSNIVQLSLSNCGDPIRSTLAREPGNKQIRH